MINTYKGNITKLQEGLYLPKLTTTQRDALVLTINDRVLIYNITTNNYQEWNGTQWNDFNDGNPTKEVVTIPYTDFVDAGYYSDGSVTITRIGKMICIDIYLRRNNAIVSPTRDLVLVTDIRTKIPVSWAVPRNIGLFIENNVDRSVVVGIDGSYILRDAYYATANYINTSFFGQIVYFI